MKTAVLFYGLVQRSLSHVVEDLRKHLLEPLSREGEVEVFFHSWKTGPIFNPRAGEYGVVSDPEEIALHLPEARGRTDDVDNFVKVINWEAVYKNNPMRHHCVDEASARVAIRNAMLALHSLEMVFDEFLAGTRSQADLVVVSRADLRFLGPLSIPEEIPEWSVFLPLFHAWGGVNDRFAFGRPEAMEVYSRRSAFFDGGLLNPGKQNPEWVLMKWLKRNNLRIIPTDTVFQRVRADGSVCPLDRELGSVK